MMEPPSLELLIVECIERIDHEGPSVLEELCEKHPTVADELRLAVQRLQGYGLAGDATEPSAEHAAVGTTIGDYEIVREIGRGGMGVVFEARDRNLGRHVALKMMQTSLAGNPDLAARFRRESAVAASLDHPGLMRVFAAGFHDEQPWLALELIDGPGLDREIARWRDDEAERGSIAGDALRKRISIVLAVAEALGHMHARGLVHRDVKPSNIMFRSDGSVALGDFGLARHAEDVGLTQTGAFAGTLHYASPEQVCGQRDSLAPPNDVFALGVTLYELITLVKPFDGPTQRSVLEAIERREPTDPRKHVAGLPDDICAITLRALEKEPTRRYADGTAFANDLRAFLEMRPVSARSYGTWTRTVRWVRREPLRASFATLLVLAALATAGFAGFWISQRPLVEQGRIARRVAEAEELTLQGMISMTLHSNPTRANRCFDAAIELDPREDALIGRTLGEFMVAGREAQHALLARYVHEHPESRTLRRHQARLLSQVPRKRDPKAKAEGAQVLAELGDPRDPGEFMVEALHSMADLRSSGDTASGIRMALRHNLETAILLSPKPNPILYWQLGNDVFGHTGGRAAETFAMAVLRLWPDTAFSQAIAGFALQPDHPERARAHYIRAIELDPTLETLDSRICVIDIMAERIDDARARCKGMLARPAPKPATFETWSTLLELDGDIDGAIESQDRAVRAAGKSGVEVTFRALRLMALVFQYDRLDAGLELFRAHVERVPDVPAVRVQLAQIALRLGRFEAALEPLDTWRTQLAEGEEEPGSILNMRAAIANRRGEFTKAVAYARQAVARAPSTTHRHNLARFLLGAGQASEAKRIAKELAHASELREPRFLLLLAETEKATGKLDDARYHAQLGLDMSSLRKAPEHREVKTRLRRLYRELRRAR